MAKVVGIFQTAHTPFCFMPPEQWNDVRATRPIRADVPVDDLETSKQKSLRIRNAFETLRNKLAEARPDVIVIFGDDQNECFDFTNFPSFAVYVGEEFEGAISSPEALMHDAFDSVGMKREGGAGRQRDPLRPVGRQRQAAVFRPQHGECAGKGEQHDEPAP